MSYTLKTAYGQKVEVPDGWWINTMTDEIHGCPADYPVGRQDPPEEVVGVKPNGYQLHCTAEQPYRNGAGGYSSIRKMTVSSRFPFAVVRRTMVGTEFEGVDIRPARQIHKSELGRYPTLPNLPKVCHRIMGERDRMVEFVQWADVASAYGEPDLRKLWRDMMPLEGYGLTVTYRETMNIATVCYPRPVDGKVLCHTSLEFTSLSAPERVEKYIAEHAEEYNQQRADALRTRMREMHTRRATDHAEWVKNIMGRKTIPRHLLWDDPILQFGHLCVPISFARSILSAKRYGVAVLMQKTVT